MEPSRDLTEEYGVVVGYTLVDASSWSASALMVDLPPLPVSPIIPDSLDDSVIANMGSSREESNTPSEVVVVAPSVGD